MKLGDVLSQVPGLEKRFVYYLEAQGDIRPTRLPKARIARRDYSEDDLRTIRRLWEFYERGYSLASARELLAQETGRLAYAMLRVGMRKWDEVLGLLRESERVLEAGAVYGETADLIAKLEASRQEEVFAVLHPIFDRGDLEGPPHVLRTTATVSGPAASPGEGTMLAYVLLKVPAKHIDLVLERLRSFDGIVEASVIYGETDIIAKVRVSDQAALDHLVLRQVQGLDEVEATRTFIVIGGMHWQRD